MQVQGGVSHAQDLFLQADAFGRFSVTFLLLLRPPTLVAHAITLKSTTKRHAESSTADARGDRWPPRTILLMSSIPALITRMVV